MRPLFRVSPPLIHVVGTRERLLMASVTKCVRQRRQANAVHYSLKRFNSLKTLITDEVLKALHPGQVPKEIIKIQVGPGHVLLTASRRE